MGIQDTTVESEDLDDMAPDGDEPPIDLCSNRMHESAATIEQSLDTQNIAHQMSVEQVAESSTSSARPQMSPIDMARARQIIRLRRLHRAVQEGEMFPSMLSDYAADFVERSSEHANDIDRLTDFIVFEDGKTLTEYIAECEEQQDRDY